jgi:hypothetical protein
VEGLSWVVNGRASGSAMNDGCRAALFLNWCSERCDG